MRRTVFYKVYLLVSVLYLLAVIMEWQDWAVWVRAALIPCVMGMYFAYRKRYHWVPILIMLLFWLNDLMLVSDSIQEEPVSFLPLGLAYIAFIIILFKTMKNLRLKRLLYSSFPLIVLWFAYYNYSIKDIFGEQLGKKYWYHLVYSLLASFFMITTIMRYFNKENKMNLYTVIIALTLVVNDVMNGLNNYVIPSHFFEIAAATATVFCYYFLGRFVTEFIFEPKDSQYLP